MDPKLDILIVGAGVVGCALAHGLRHRKKSVYWVEAAARAGSGMTSRNSGVIHAGIYYPSASLKTRLCREGSRLLYQFAAQHGVAHRRTGKFLVANNAEQATYLTSLSENNPTVPLEQVKRLPAGIRAEQAVFSPLTGIVDQHELVAALIQASGIEPIYHQPVTQMNCLGKRVRVRIGQDHYSARWVFNCTGLHATDFIGKYQHHFARGSYFRVAMPHSVSTPDLVYPTVPKQSVSLGIHLTRNLYGETFLGPDITWISEENYTVDEADRQKFFESAKTYLPWLTTDMLQPAYAGIRAKLSREGFHDFCLDREGEAGQLCHFLGIESPGLTAAMALAKYALVQMGLDA